MKVSNYVLHRLCILSAMHHRAHIIKIKPTFIMCQENNHGCKHQGNKDLELTKNTNLYLVALYPNMLAVIEFDVRTCSKLDGVLSIGKIRGLFDLPNCIPTIGIRAACSV